jgi:hypothetical protein
MSMAMHQRIKPIRRAKAKAQAKPLTIEQPVNGKLRMDRWLEALQSLLDDGGLDMTAAQELLGIAQNWRK